MVCFRTSGGLLGGSAVQPDPAHLRASGISHVPEGEGGGPAARAVPQDRWVLSYLAVSHSSPPLRTSLTSPALSLSLSCTLSGVGAMTWSPLACGIVSGKYDSGIPPYSRASLKVSTAVGGGVPLA